MPSTLLPIAVLSHGSCRPFLRMQPHAFKFVFLTSLVSAILSVAFNFYLVSVFLPSNSLLEKK